MISLSSYIGNQRIVRLSVAKRFEAAVCAHFVIYDLPAPSPKKRKWQRFDHIDMPTAGQSSGAVTKKLLDSFYPIEVKV